MVERVMSLLPDFNPTVQLLLQTLGFASVCFHITADTRPDGEIIAVTCYEERVY